MERIAAGSQHFFIIVGFKKNGIALPEMINNLFAGFTNICKYAYTNAVIILHNKTMRIAGIMFFSKRFYGKPTNPYSFVGREIIHAVCRNGKPAALQRSGGYINRDII